MLDPYRVKTIKHPMSYISHKDVFAPWRSVPIKGQKEQLLYSMYVACLWKPSFGLSGIPRQGNPERGGTEFGVIGRPSVPVRGQRGDGCGDSVPSENRAVGCCYPQSINSETTIHGNKKPEMLDSQI